MVDQPPNASPPPRQPRGALVVALVFLGIAVAAAVALLVPPAEVPPPPVVAAKPQPAAMAPVALERLPALPADAAAAEAARALVNSRTAPSLVVGVDGDTAAWLRAVAEADARAPLIPQRLGPADLAVGGAPADTEAMLVARLDDRAAAGGADDGWQWLLLHLAKDQYAVALAPPASRDLVIGRDARVLGRFVGRAPLPVEGGEQATPLVAARAALPADDVVGTTTDDPLAEFHAARFSMPGDVFADVADERPLVETRPYYYLLGQAKLDVTSGGVYDDALDANRDGSRVHDEPPAWRGKPMRVAGTVINVWKDEQASGDRPFEVTDVWRVQLISTDLGEVRVPTVTGDTRKTMLVSRLYEVALAGPQAPPKEGERIAATGRFLKWRAMPIEVDMRRDTKNGVHRESDRVYALLIVAPEWRPAPKPPSGPRAAPAWVLWATLGLASCASVLVLWSWRRADARARAMRPKRRRGRVGTGGAPPQTPG